ncbi:MAG: CCA tRNA nucleotidyltransferase [Ruminococcaceae bacterium]|nr:CCA tRNA nucleotidyltransferase [Oscillospiraceae bacterium]
MICLSEAVDKVIKRLESLGFESYVVGGSIRDTLLNLNPVDWDIATNANPVQIIEAFKGERKNLSGIKFGTVSVAIDDISIDITTYRTEGEYEDFRHPREISFSSGLFEDMKRRDFTVNALAYNRKDGVIDYFGGLNDLSSGVIKCVGDPSEKFSEDALRIIRAFRFASELNFKIDKQTLNVAMKKMSLLNNISNERIQCETTRLILGKGAGKVLADYPEIIFSIIPELEPLKYISQYEGVPRFSVWDHVVKVIKSSPCEPHIRWAALLHDIGKQDIVPEVSNVRERYMEHAEKSEKMAETILSRLNFKKSLKKKILLIIRNHSRLKSMESKDIKKYLADYGKIDFFDLFSFAIADNEGQLEGMKYPKELYKKIKNTADEIIEDGRYYKIEDLSINGKELAEMGYVGKDIGGVLKKLHEAVLDDTVKNDKECLTDYLKQIKAGS